MSESPKFARVMLILAAVSTTLPIFAGYTVGSLLLLWLMMTGSWRLARVGVSHIPSLLSQDAFLIQTIARAVRPLHWGCCILVVAQLAAAVGGCIWSPWSKSLSRSLAEWSHVAVKFGLLWYVLSASCIAQVRMGWSPKRIGPWLFGWLLLQLCYCVAQHWTGIDWVHGIGAFLGSHRYAYGVYRVSGFMGHPLTFAYNMMLITLTSFAMAWRLSGDDEQNRRWWLGCGMVCVASLLISGSRYVLLILFAVLVICELPRLWRHKFKVLSVTALLAAVLIAEGSVLGRFYEFFQEKVPFDQRFSRLIYWRTHWQMFFDHPVFGVTRTGLPSALEAYYTAAGYHGTMYEAHNLFLQYLADSGLVGFLGLAAWLAGLGVSWWRLRQLKSGQGVSYIAIATLLCALMQNNLRDSAYIYVLWFSLILLIVQSSAIHVSQQELVQDERKSSQDFQPGSHCADPAADLRG